MRLSRGQLLQLIGAVCIIAAVLLSSVSFQGLRYSDFKKNGISAQAAVIDKYILRERKAVKGSYLYRSDYLLDISFFTAEQVSGSKFMAFDIPVSESSIMQLHQGDIITIIYLPDNPQSTAVLSSELETGLTGKDNADIEKIKISGITEEATVEDIDPVHNKIRVMFFSSFSGGIGELVLVTVGVTKTVWDSSQTGGHIEVLYLPDNPQSKVFVKSMVDDGVFSPYVWFAISAVLVAAGGALLWKFRGAWRKQKESPPRPE